MEPSWKVPETLLISTNALAGELANWATQQSPYDAPDNLVEAIKDFRAAWPSEDEFKDVLPMKWWDSYDDLYDALYNLFCETPSIRVWNEPRSQHGAAIVFSDRYGGPAPDDDFIDLGALANNVAREAWKDALDEKKFGDDFDRRWEAEHGTKPFAQGIDAPEGGETEGLDPKDESPVGAADAPKEPLP